MKQRKTLQRMLLGLLGLLLVCTVVGIAGWITILKPTMDNVMRRIGTSACVSVFEDLNGDGRPVTSEPVLHELPGAEVIVDDPGGKDSGRFAISDCYLRPGPGQPRTIHLTVILPPGYTATTPLQWDVQVYAMFPYPAAYIGVQRAATP